MAKVKIDPQFSKMLPPVLEDDELETAVLDDGRIFEPLVIWKHQNILLDGHRRYRLMIKHPHLKAPKPIVLDLRDRQTAHDWVIDHQLSKRNIAPDDRRTLIGQLYNAHKPARGGEQPEEPSGCSAQEIAEKYGVSERTVRSAGKYAAAVDAAAETAGPEVKDAVLKGEVAATTADLEKLAELPKAKRKKAAKAIAAGEVKSVGAAVKAVAPKDDADEGGWEPSEAKPHLDKLKKHIAAARREYADAFKKLGSPDSLKGVWTGLEAAGQSLERFRRKQIKVV
jgi:hypothetical protein